MLGLPYAFASHFAPEQLPEAVATYRARFRPSHYLATPHVMLGVNVFAAETDAEALRLFSSLQQAFLNLRRGRPGKLPPPSTISTQGSTHERAPCWLMPWLAQSSAGQRQCGADFRPSSRPPEPTS